MAFVIRKLSELVAFRMGIVWLQPEDVPQDTDHSMGGMYVEVVEKWEDLWYNKISINRNLEELMMKKMIMALCIFICVFTLVACSGQQTNEPLTLGVNAIITEIDKENKIITAKDSEEKGVLGDDCLIDCSKIPMIYCNYDTQKVVAITLDDLQVGDEIILTIRSSEIENLQKEDDNKTKIAVEQLQLGTQRIK